MTNEIDIDLFTRILADNIKLRWELKEMKLFTYIKMTEFMKAEIEHLYKIKPEYPFENIYNDVLCDVLDTLQIDYEIDRKKGLIITGEE